MLKDYNAAHLHARQIAHYFSVHGQHTLFQLQAADIVQQVGIGRNEYIAIMNKCKAKKLLWRVNKSIAKEFLPVTPLDINMQPWWTVGVVNLSKSLCSSAVRPLNMGHASTHTFCPFLVNECDLHQALVNVLCVLLACWGSSTAVGSSAFAFCICQCQHASECANTAVLPVPAIFYIYRGAWQHVHVHASCL